MVELPLVVIDVQRAGPSTGMPTKNEQADLLQVMFGRNRLPVADRRAGDAGRMLRLRHRGLATRPEVHDAGRVPVDAFLATGSEPWRIPATSTSRRSPSRRPRATVPSSRICAIPTRSPGRAVPGTAGLEHRSAASRSRHHRQRQLRPREPSPDADPAPRRSPASRRTSRPSRYSGRRTATCSSSAGVRPTAPSAPLERLHAEGHSVAHGTCATSTRSPRTPRRSCGATARCSSRR